MKKQQPETAKRLRSTPADSAATGQPIPTSEPRASQGAKAADSTGYQDALLNVMQGGLLPAEKQTAEFWISQVMDTFNFLYSRMGLPLKLRPFINALIGASNGDTDWFECRDRDLASRMMGDAADGKTSDALKKTVQRLRDALIEWQLKNNYELVEIDKGYAEYLRNKKTGEVITNPDGTRALGFQSTRYRLPLLPHAKRVLIEAYTHPTKPGDVSLIAKKLMALLRHQPMQWDSAGRQDEARQLRRFRSQGITNIRKAIELERKQGGDPRYFFETVFDEIEEKALMPIE
jgi:hypothetical protein